MRKQMPPDLKTLWKQAVTPLAASMSGEDFATWIEPMHPLELGGGVLEVSVPNRMFAAWIEENYLDDLARSWTRASGHKTRFEFTWGQLSNQGELFALKRSQQPQQAALFSDDETKIPAPAAKPRLAPKLGGLIDRYEFSSFVTGPSNQFARAAAIAVAGQPGTLYNPFFVFGGVGLGKTHLVNAIGNTILEKQSSARVLFMSADTFTNRLIDAISKNKAPEFKNRMRRVDCLILDDVQFLSGRERTQEEFFHIFNALYESGRQIVLTSDKFPHELKGVEERLCNRFGWGLVADIQVPDVETRVAIIERKANDEGIDLPLNVASFIAERFESNIRDLEGALTRLSAWSSLNRCEITLSLAEKLLGVVSPDSPLGLTLEEIDARVVTHFGLQPGQLQIRKRTKKIAEARVVHGCQAVKRRLENEPRFRNMLETLSRVLGCG